MLYKIPTVNKKGKKSNVIDLNNNLENKTYFSTNSSFKFANPGPRNDHLILIQGQLPSLHHLTVRHMMSRPLKNMLENDNRNDAVFYRWVSTLHHKYGSKIIFRINFQINNSFFLTKKTRNRRLKMGNQKR